MLVEDVNTDVQEIKEITKSVFERNLEYMVELFAREKAPQTMKMLRKDFPAIKNFQQLRSLGQAFLANDCKPLRRLPCDASVDVENLEGEAKLRFHDGFFLLAKNEALVFHNESAHGPYSKEEVAFMAKKLGAQSPTHDKDGHILDPEDITAKPTTTSVEL